MRTRIPRWPAAIVAIAGLAITLAACGGGSSEPDPLAGPPTEAPAGDDGAPQATDTDTGAADQSTDQGTGQPADIPADTGAEASSPDDGTPDDATPDNGQAAPADDQSAADAPPTDDTGTDDAATGEPGAEEPADAAEPPPGDADLSVVRIMPSDIPQPAVPEPVADVPLRPAEYAAYAVTALPWLQGLTTVDAIIPLFEAWGMPPVAGGSRLNLVDTNADAAAPDDGLSSLVIIYTDPASFGTEHVTSNLVVYEPRPGEPGRFYVAYDHNYIQATRGGLPPSTDIVVTGVVDVTGDDLRDIAFQETVCEGDDCRVVSYLLSRDGDVYVRTIVG